jgi:hypothetical protein
VGVDLDTLRQLREMFGTDVAILLAAFFVVRELRAIGRTSELLLSAAGKLEHSINGLRQALVAAVRAPQESRGR